MRGGRRAPGSPCGARGRNVWRRHAAPRSPAGRGTGRAGVRGAVVARARVVVVVARPVVRHTRPTADCRPAASGPSVSRSSSCACSPCGDPPDIAMVPYIAMVTSIGMVASIGRVASRLGESVAEGIRLPRGDRGLRDPPASRARASVPASRASGRRTVAARVSLGGEWSPAPRRRRGWRRAPAPPCTAASQPRLSCLIIPGYEA